MNKYIVYLLVAALITSLSFAQQNKSTPEHEIVGVIDAEHLR